MAKRSAKGQCGSEQKRSIGAASGRLSRKGPAKVSASSAGRLTAREGPKLEKTRVAGVDHHHGGIGEEPVELAEVVYHARLGRD